MSHYQEGSARPSLFAVNLGYTSAFPTRALDDPRRHPNEALADFHRAADRILQGRNYSPLSETESEGENSDSGDDSDDSYESIFGGDSNTAGPTDDQREAFLSRAIDAARKQLEADFAMFHKEARNTRRTGNTHRTHRTHRERQKSRAATVPATEANSQLSEAHRPTWQQVPDNMKLILVKELTSDFSYSKAVQLLRLTVAEEAALRALYDREQRKVARHRAALDAYADQGLDAYTRQKPVQRPDEEEGRTPPYALTAIKGCYLLPPVDEPQLLTDFVSVQHMTAALDFLHGLGFAPGTVDLGHWVGHSGGGRFEMDIPDRHEVCEVGHHGRALLGSTHQETSAIRPMRESKSKQSRQSIGTKRGRPKAKTTAGGLKLKRLPTWMPADSQLSIATSKSPENREAAASTMAPPRIEQKEIDTYWNIFSTRTNGGKFMTGEQAAPVLKNSGLRDNQLERVWDLADVDNDGNLDFEEFCVAMRLIFDILNGAYPDVPTTLPDWLVPESKAHLVQAGRALTGKAAQFEQVEVDDPDSPGLQDGFDWYMSPADKAKYEQIYMESRDMRGEVSFAALQDLYESLDVPDTDIRSAWNLVNPSAGSSINKDACLAFLHILNYRHEGYRIPRTVPASLRASFEHNQIDYQVGNASTAAATGTATAAARARWGTKADDSTSTGRKAKFGDQYLTRLGRSGFTSAGTDFSSEQKTEDWEEVRLKKQLHDLETRIADVETGSVRRSGGTASGKRETKLALVKRELEQLLDYKRKELRDLEEGTGKAKAAGSLRGVGDDLKTVREQVESLEAHLRTRESVLEQLRREIDDAKVR